MKNVEGRGVVRAVGELLWMNAAMFHAMGWKVARAAIWEGETDDAM
jgi:hypothetical protein